MKNRKLKIVLEQLLDEGKIAPDDRHIVEQFINNDETNFEAFFEFWIRYFDLIIMFNEFLE